MGRDRQRRTSPRTARGRGGELPAGCGGRSAPSAGLEQPRQPVARAGGERGGGGRLPQGGGARPGLRAGLDEPRRPARFRAALHGGGGGMAAGGGTRASRRGCVVPARRRTGTGGASPRGDPRDRAGDRGRHPRASAGHQPPRPAARRPRDGPPAGGVSRGGRFGARAAAAEGRRPPGGDRRRGSHRRVRRLARAPAGRCDRAGREGGDIERAGARGRGALTHRFPRFSRDASESTRPRTIQPSAVSTRRWPGTSRATLPSRGRRPTTRPAKGCTRGNW